MNDIYVTWRSFSVGTTPVWSQPVKDSLSDVKTIIENGKKMLEAARELGPIDVDPEKIVCQSTMTAQQWSVSW